MLKLNILLRNTNKCFQFYFQSSLLAKGFRSTPLPLKGTEWTENPWLAIMYLDSVLKLGLVGRDIFFFKFAQKINRKYKLIENDLLTIGFQESSTLCFLDRRGIYKKKILLILESLFYISKIIMIFIGWLTSHWQCHFLSADTAGIYNTKHNKFWFINKEILNKIDFPWVNGERELVNNYSVLLGKWRMSRAGVRWTLRG